MNILAGVDIGGTKCAVCVGETDGDKVNILGKRRFATPSSPGDTQTEISIHLEGLLAEFGVRHRLKAIGVSCGGPLNLRLGLVLSPPNLPGWDRVDVVTPLQEQFGVPAALQNDANASALAEWKWGAGRGCRNIVFLTFGTGMGAGLIINGRLYAGTNDMAGEVGHIRMESIGPVGYGKRGSLEGFCSGGGIANLGQILAVEQLQLNQPVSFCATFEELSSITAEKIGEAARHGDPVALQVYEIAARELGRGLAILVDILNPERIIIGSIYNRQRQLLEKIALDTLKAEALPQSVAVCAVVPAELGESVGDLASLSVALNCLE